MKSNTPIEVAKIDGRICVRTQGMPAGIFYKYDHQIDSLVGHVWRELGGFRDMTHFCASAGLHKTGIPHLQKGEYKISDRWLLRLHEFSGIPVDELRLVAMLPCLIEAHPNARSQGAAP